MTAFWASAKARGARFWWPAPVLGLLGLVLVLLPLDFLEKLRILSAGVCAQRNAHSILFGGVQPPLEARMIGIYGGFMASVVYFVVTGRGKTSKLPRIPFLVIAALGVVLMGIDGTNALFRDIRLPHLYEPDNRLRLLTGTLAGLGVALFIVPILNFTIWKRPDQRMNVDSWGLMAGLLLTVFAFDAVVLTGASWLLYPVSVFSVLGVVALVFGVSLLMVLSFTRGEGAAESWLDLLHPGAVAVSFALAVLLGMAGLRFWAEATLGITPL